MIKGSSVNKKRELADGHCEALLNVRPDVWTRCGTGPIEIHHRLTRARGGLILDEAGELYHLIALCRTHHDYAHKSAAATQVGLLLDGYVVSDDGRPWYVGPDPYLRETWGKPIPPDPKLTMKAWER